MKMAYFSSKTIISGLLLSVSALCISLGTAVWAQELPTLASAPNSPGQLKQFEGFLETFQSLVQPSFAGQMQKWGQVEGLVDHLKGRLRSCDPALATDGQDPVKLTKNAMDFLHIASKAILKGNIDLASVIKQADQQVQNFLTKGERPVLPAHIPLIFNQKMYNIFINESKVPYLELGIPLGSGASKSWGLYINLLDFKVYAGQMSKVMFSSSSAPTTTLEDKILHDLWQRRKHKSPERPYPLGVVRVKEIIQVLKNYRTQNNLTTLVLQKRYDADVEKAQENGAPWSRAMKQDMFRHLAHGVKYFHDQGIIHRDIKPGNILVAYFIDPRTLHSTYKAHLTDFDFAIPLSQYGQQTAKVSPFYVSPEFLNRHSTTYNKSSPASDVWALGLVFYHIYYDKLPWWNQQCEEWALDQAKKKRVDGMKVFFSCLEKIFFAPQTGQYQEIMQAPADPNSMEFLIWQMLRPNPQLRPSINQVMESLSRQGH